MSPSIVSARVRLFATAFLLILSARPGLAVTQKPLAREAVAFAEWAARYDTNTDPAARSLLLPEGIAAASQRRAALRSLMETDPQSALAMSRATTNFNGLPPEVRSQMETPFATTGDYIVQGALAAQGGPTVAPLRRWVRFGGQSYRAQVFGQRLSTTTQLAVPLSGITLDGLAVVDEPAITSLATEANAPTAWTTGGKNILIIRVDFSDLTGAPENYSVATVQNIADSQISPYYAKSSYGLTTLTNTVSTAVYRMPQTAAYYASNDANDTLHADAQSAAAANYTLANYDRIIVFFSSLGGLSGSQITYGGLADIGSKRVWCNGEFDFRVIAHELGHTFGLWHANLWQVSDGNPISAAGIDTEYGDDFDTMGANYANSQSTDFGPWFKNRLGWLGDSQVITVTSSGTYRIYAFDQSNYAAAPGESLALKIVKNGTYNYWVGCRRDFTSNSSLTNGVYVEWGYNNNRASDLLDMNTPGNSDQDAGLLIGGIFTDIAAANGQGVTIHPLARGGTPPNEYRDIQVIFGTAPPLAPTFTLTPTGQAGVLGKSVSFAAAASGNPAPTYQWQCLSAGSANWTTLSDNSTYSGTATTNLTVNLTSFDLSGSLYRCLAANSQGTSTSAPPASLTMNAALTIATLNGQAGTLGTANGTGTNALFAYPFSLVCDSVGNIFVAQYYNGQIRKITPGGTVTTFASGFSGPKGIAIDAADNLYVSDTLHDQVKRVSTTGTITVLGGTSGVVGSVDGTNTAALFSRPWGIAVDSFTNVFVADNDSNVVRKITRIGNTANWATTTIAGLAGQTGSNDGTNSQARFNSPASLTCDRAGNVYVADFYNDTIRKITPDATGTNWIVTTIAGQAGIYGRRDGLGTNALFGYPTGIAADPAGNLYVTDSGSDLIRLISTNGAVTTIAGSSGSADGFYTAAGFSSPYGIAVDPFGNIYIADTFNYTIRVAHVAQVTTPSLVLSQVSHNSVLNWPVPTNPYRLQVTTNLTPANWIAITNQPWTVNNHNLVTNPASAGTMFYRLVYP